MAQKRSRTADRRARADKQQTPPVHRPHTRHDLRHTDRPTLHHHLANLQQHIQQAHTRREDTPTTTSTSTPTHDALKALLDAQDQHARDALAERTVEEQRALLHAIAAPPPSGASLEYRTHRILFLTRAYAALDDERLRAHVLPLVSLPSWTALSEARRAPLLSAQPVLAKKYKAWLKRRAKEAQMGAAAPSSLEEDFLPTLLHEYATALAAADGVEDARFAPGPPLWRHLERLAGLFADLMAQMPTRRFFHPLLLDSHLLSHAALSPHVASEDGRLLRRLLEILGDYERHPIDDHSALQIGDDELRSRRSVELQALQRAAFPMERLRTFALCNHSAINTARTLKSQLGALPPDDLARLCADVGLVSDSAEALRLGVPLLLQLVCDRYARRPLQHEVISSLPLYPDESITWDESLVPPSSDDFGESCLALPKLNLQFLSLTDYMVRNFGLYRLDATYEIREDVQDAVQRLQPRAPTPAAAGGGETSFRGWARMAQPLAAFRIAKVGRPHLGELQPSEVRAEATISLAGCRPDVAREWSALRRHDVVFLLSVRPPASGADDKTLPWRERVGLVAMRGAEVVQVRDGEGHVFVGESSEASEELRGSQRHVELVLDAAQYHVDAQMLADGHRADDVYGTFNVLVRRRKENNFKATLECIRDLVTSPTSVPDWLHDVLLGYGDPSGAAYWSLPSDKRVVDFDFYDTFLDLDHVRESFPACDVKLDPTVASSSLPPPPYRLRIPTDTPRAPEVTPDDGPRPVVEVSPYPAVVAGPYPDDAPRFNTIRFTPLQAEALRASMNPGLTLVVGPPGTGKTDTVVQMISNIFHMFPTQRTLVVAHSNQALNDVFEKLLLRDMDERYLLRLGHGEDLLATTKDFSRRGRVDHMLQRRLDLLARVDELGRVLGATADVGYTCETAQYFYLTTVFPRWKAYESALREARAAGGDASSSCAAELFPFTEFFADAPQPIFAGKSLDADTDGARACFRHVQAIFSELEECRPFELLRSSHDRGNHLLTTHAKVIAMTCTHAALNRRDFLALGFQYDNLVIEEAAQMLEIETFIPMVLQAPDVATGRSRLKRVALIGDHNQLPPVVKNSAFQKYSRLDQSLFARLIRLGVPAIELDRQGRARAQIADLYRWRYTNLGDLPSVATDERFRLAVPGFAYPFQLVNVVDPQGVGESSPLPHYVQNLAEAEYVIATYMYMRLRGIAAEKISIITTYNGQRDLIADVAKHRCANSALFGLPAKISTTDKFQGQQNDYILLSLVRTRAVGHLRDARRLVVSVSRARLGLYVFCDRRLFESCAELQPTLSQLLTHTDELALLPSECAPTTRSVNHVPTEGVVKVSGLLEMGQVVAALSAAVRP